MARSGANQKEAPFGSVQVHPQSAWLSVVTSSLASAVLLLTGMLVSFCLFEFSHVL